MPADWELLSLGTVWFSKHDAAAIGCGYQRYQEVILPRWLVIMVITFFS